MAFDNQRTVTLILFLIFACILALQGASYYAHARAAKLQERYQLTADVANEQRLRAHEYRRSTYSAVLGLATSDWQLLLDQRRQASKFSEDFLDANQAIVGGGEATVSGRPVELMPLYDEEIVRHLQNAEQAWNRAVLQQTRVLRSNNYGLEDNLTLKAFEGEMREVSESLDKATVAILRRTEQELATPAKLQSTVPGVGAAVTVFLAIFVVLRLVGPLSRTATRLNTIKVELERRLTELRKAQTALLKASREAGKAEIATNVLHNVGNVLNSVNVSARLMAERIERDTTFDLERLARVLNEQSNSLPEFFATERGRAVPHVLERLVARFSESRGQLGEEIEALQQRIDHIKTVVAAQQAHARSARVVERVSIDEVVDHARLLAASSAHEQIHFVRNYEDVEPFYLDRHRAEEVLVNLIANAKDSLRKQQPENAIVEITICRDTNFVKITVTDNGVGISPENMPRLFEHGFSTKENGHGFGLHSSAIAANELGGRLTCHSDGEGLGATFEFYLPFRTTRATKEAGNEAMVIERDQREQAGSIDVA